MENRTDRQSFIVLAALVGSLFSWLFVWSFIGSIYVLSLMSIALLTLATIMYRPRNEGWFENWDGRPRHAFTFASALGLIAGSMNILFYDGRSFSSLLCGIIAFVVGIATLIMCIYANNNYRVQIVKKNIQ
ncbi:hypothetical protein Mpt1_c11680 [Candidatus Methanoplasma termitum]|uniref:Uncharacterized protein n=1 Tax=Candidatus Methanoplasma termitum TaxID=1577791 RepID=A0A0A7LCZ3_9ARCH|nr:hypothetical protein Mpt1_c11680 [Candidatus Methanoplasma termitum]